MLWAMRSKKNCKMPHMRSWNVEEHAYDGLCSHCALIEAIPGQHDLTADEREVHAVEMKELMLQAQRLWKSVTRFRCATCSTRF